MSAGFARKMIAFSVVVLLFSCGLTMLIPAWNNIVSATNIPSTFSSDWTITTPITYDGGSSVITGNLTIKSGGNLVLNNLTLAFAPSFNGQYHMDIESGGILSMGNTIIKANGATRMHWFHSNGTLSIINSTLRDFGLNRQFDGVNIMGGSAVLKGDTFANNDIGLKISHIVPTIKGCTIINSWDSGLEVNSTTLTVWGLTTFHNSMGFGMGGSVWVGQGAVLTLHNSSISHNYGYGIAVDGGTSATFYNSTNSDNMCGLYMICDYDVGNFGASANLTYYNTPHTGGLMLGTGNHVTTYWYVNITATWQSDGHPAAAANYRFYNKTGVKTLDGYADGNGIRKLLVVRESVESDKTIQDNPYIINVTGIRNGKSRYDTYNSTINVSKDLSFVLDDVAPKLDIISPQNGSTTNLTQVQVKALTDPGAKGFVNGTQFAVDNMGNFKGTASLPHEGSNLVTVKAQDIQGNEAVVILNITRDSTPPFITLITPVPGGLYNSTVIHVIGSTEPEATMKVNNVLTYPLVDGTFNTTVTEPDGLDTIIVKSTDKLGNTATLSVSFTVDTVAPDLNIVAPADKSGTRNTTIKVTGTTEAGANLTVNGIVVPLTGTGFNATVNLVEGSNLIVVKSCDKANNCVIDTLHITRDTVAPKLTVTSPPDTKPVMTNGAKYTIKGTTEIGAKLTISGVSAPISSNGSFTQYVTLAEGPNNITIRATDAFGNFAEVFRNIIKDTVPPALTITSPSSGTRVRTMQVQVQGTIEAGASLAFGKQAIAYNGTTFSATVPLDREGQNTLTFTATDGAGNTKTATVLVERDSIVTITVNTPTNNSEVQVGAITVAGHTDSKATVNINGKDTTADLSGMFSVKVNLKVGTNVLVIKATDDLGNTNTTMVTVVRKQSDNGLGGMLMWVVLIVIIVVIVAVVGVLMWRKGKKKDPMPGDRNLMLESEP